MFLGGKRRQYNSAGPFVVRRCFLLDGHRYVAGDDFPVGAAIERKKRQLYDSRKIDVSATPSSKTKEQVDAPHVALPDNWRDMTNKDLFPLVLQLTGKRVSNRAMAYKAIEDHIHGAVDGRSG